MLRKLLFAAGIGYLFRRWRSHRTGAALGGRW